MVAKLTKRVVEGINPGEREVIVWDSDLPGFGVRVSPKGKRTYILKYRVGGGRGGTARKPKIGVHGVLTVEQARAKARQWLAEVAQGGDPGGDIQAGREAPTVTELCERYLEEHARPHKKARSAHEDERMIANHIKPRLGAKKVTDVTRADIDRTLAAIKAGRTAKDVKTRKHGRAIVRGGPIAANRTLALLSKMFNLAERWGLRPGYSNPCLHARKYPERRRERFLTQEEVGRLGEALAAAEADAGVSPAAAAAIRLLVFTGCRVGEILTLHWADVDFERVCLRLRESKTGAKVVYLAAPALDVLAALPRVEGNPHVLPGASDGAGLSGLKKPWARVCNLADLSDVRLHDLRHSFASVGAAAGVPLLIIGKMLGHSQSATTERYAHLAADPVKQAVETVAAVLDAAMRGAPRGELVPLPARRRGDGS